MYDGNDAGDWSELAEIWIPLNSMGLVKRQRNRVRWLQLYLQAISEEGNAFSRDMARKALRRDHRMNTGEPQR